MGAQALITPAERVDVYFDLHRKVWSCKSRKTGRVEHKGRAVVAPHGATFVVSEAGRQRVLAEQCKNVHAYARIDVGTVCKTGRGWERLLSDVEGLREVSYNPYRAGHFFDVATGDPVYKALSLVMLALPDQKPKVLAHI